MYYGQNDENYVKKYKFYKNKTIKNINFTFINIHKKI